MKYQPPPQSVPWTVRDIWLGVSSFVIWIGVLISFRVAATRFVIDLDPGVIVSLGELLLLIPVWLLTVAKYGVGWQALGLRRFAPAALRVGCGLMFISFLFNFVYGAILGLFGQRMQIDLVPIFQELSSPWLFLLGGALIAPVVEEIFFRGFVFAGLRPQYGWQKAALISSLMFAFVHFSFYAIIPIFILGYIFAFLYYLSDSIWPSILMHILTNSLALGGQMLIAYQGI